MARIELHEGSPELLSATDQFFKELGSIPRLQTRLRTWHYKLTFDSRVESARSSDLSAAEGVSAARKTMAALRTGLAETQRELKDFNQELSDGETAKTVVLTVDGEDEEMDDEYGTIMTEFAAHALAELDALAADLPPEARTSQYS